MVEAPKPTALPPCKLPPRAGKMRSLGGVPDDEHDTLTITGETVNLLTEREAKRADWEREAIACMKSRGVIPADY